MTLLLVLGYHNEVQRIATSLILWQWNMALLYVAKVPQRNGGRCCVAICCKGIATKRGSSLYEIHIAMTMGIG